MFKKALVVFGALCLVAILLCLAGAAMAPRFGWHVTVVGGGSMEPAIAAGGVVVVQPVDTQSIAAGDVVLYAPPSAPGTTTIHRVVEVVVENGALQFRTQGDANDAPDPYLVPAQNVKGQVRLLVPYLGYALSGIGTPLGRSLLFGVPALMLIAYELRNVCVAVRARRGRSQRRRPVTAAGAPVKTAQRSAPRIRRG